MDARGVPALAAPGVQEDGLCSGVGDGQGAQGAQQGLIVALAEEIPPGPCHSGVVAGPEGVLLLNAALTVRAGAPNSHRGMGWEQFTDHVISLLNERADPMIFLLWGRNAREKKPLISNPAHRVLEAPHPSPMSAGYGFFGCRHFSKTNALLGEMGKGPVDWQIPQKGVGF